MRLPGFYFVILCQSNPEKKKGDDADSNFYCAFNNRPVYYVLV
jgi:hypothetical protein